MAEEEKKKEEETEKAEPAAESPKDEAAGEKGEDSAAELIKQIVEKIDEAIKTAEKDSSVKVTLRLVKQDDKWLVSDMNKTDDFFRSLFGSLQKWIDGSSSFFGA